MEQLNRLKASLKPNQVALISHPANLFWCTGFTGSAGLALVSSSEAWFITDERYTIQAEQEVKPNGFSIEVITPTDSLKALACSKIDTLKASEVLFENTLSYQEWADWSEQVKQEFKPMGLLISNLRFIKTASEIEKLKKACVLAQNALDHIQHLLKPGISEIDIQLDLEFYLKRHGSEMSFFPIVLSGPNSAKPHGKAGERLLQDGDMMVIDFGAVYQGYRSDITRSFLIGEPTDLGKRVYQAVLEAQLASLEAIKPGALGKEVDKISRDVLAKYGFSYGHGLGHSLGIEVHDGFRMNPMSDVVLQEGQVWTVEPGTYLTDIGGIRIEDDIVVTANGFEFLTHYKK